MRSFSRSIFLAAALVGSFATVGCGQSDIGEDGASTSGELENLPMLDVNDVSILFGGPKPFPEISLTEKLPDGNTLMTLAALPQEAGFPSVFDQVTGFAQKQRISFRNKGNDIANWRIFAARFDPCAPGKAFNGNGDETKCKVQLRLIAQPMNTSGTSMQDIAMHLVYGLGTVAELKAEKITGADGKTTNRMALLRAGLVDIKQAATDAKTPTAGQPLGVHPGLVTGSAGQSTVGPKVKQYLFTEIAKAKEMQIAFMGLQNDGAEPWIFLAGAVARVPATAILGPTPPAGVPAVVTAFIPLPKTGKIAGSPALPDGTSAEVFQPFSSPAVVGILLDGTNSGAPRLAADATGPASTLSLFGASADPSSLAFKVENPETAHFFNTDCVSCHTSTSRTIMLHTESNENRMRVPAGITGYVRTNALQNALWNTRNFGWFGGAPSVSMRTVNESVEVAEELNVGVKPTTAGFVGPGADCTAIDDDVWKCFRDGDGADGTTCMLKCKASAPSTPVEQPPVTLDPLPSDDNCAAMADTTKNNITSTATTVTFSGAGAKCIGRPLGGFRSPGFTLSCKDKGDNDGDQLCTVTATKFPMNIVKIGTSNHGKRLADLLKRVVPRVNNLETFSVSDGVNTLTITCDTAKSAATCKASFTAN